MTNNPEEIRRDIERTRAELSQDVNTLAEEANPATMARRKVEGVKSGARGLRNRVFGDPEDPWDEGAVGDVGHRAQSAVEDAAGAVQDVPRRVGRSTQGNPLAAGLVAFGLGALVGGLLPSTRTERDMAVKAKEQAQPLLDEAAGMAQEAVDHVRPRAEEALENVKDAATSAGQHVRDEAMVGKDAVADQARVSAEEVRQDDRNPL